MPEINDLINATINKSPVDFSAVLNDILQQKASEAIEDRRFEIAQSLYGDNNTSQDNEQIDLDLNLDDIDPTVDLNDDDGDNDNENN